MSSRSKPADPSVRPASINTGLVILAFGAVWVVFLRGLTALGANGLTFPYLDPFFEPDVWNPPATAAISRACLNLEPLAETYLPEAISRRLLWPIGMIRWWTGRKRMVLFT